MKFGSSRAPWPKSLLHYLQHDGKLNSIRSLDNQDISYQFNTWIFFAYCWVSKIGAGQQSSTHAHIRTYRHAMVRASLERHELWAIHHDSYPGAGTTSCSMYTYFTVLLASSHQQRGK
eukprot:scaffold200_cov173-Amphora_coffeaeformis.AAC.11